MRPFGDLTAWTDALTVAAELGVATERRDRVALLQAADRVLATDALSRIEVPSADRAAMDGYALRAAEAPAGGELTVARRVSAGAPAEAEPMAPGTCIEIATGAPLPAGADAVVPVERTERVGAAVRIEGSIATGQHVSTRGEDLRQGQPIGREGDLLTPALLSACVAGGIEDVDVWARPRVLVAPTGDEVVPLGRPLALGQVYDSNAAGVQALAYAAGARPEHAGIVVDRLDALLGLLEQQEFDLIVTIGGTSVGRRDLVSEAMARIGEVRVHGVAVKPGKPLLLGRVDGRAMVGLPGFPTSCMMQAYAIVAPMIRRMARRPPSPDPRRAPLTGEISSPPGKVQLIPVALDGEGATPTFRMSSAISSIANANGWIEVPAEVRSLSAGDEVVVHLF